MTGTSSADGAWADIFADPADRQRVPWGAGWLRFTASPSTISLLSLQIVDDWLRYGQIRYPQFQVNLPTGGVPPTLYTETRPYLALTMPGYPNTDQIAEQVRQGATLRFVNIDDWYPPIARICDRISGLCDSTVRAYGFYTAPGNDGVHPHRDDADIFVLQIAGSKRWQLWNVPPDDDWVPGTPVTDAGDADYATELAAGDGLYVPAGMGHRAVAGPGGSLHLSIAIRQATYRDVVRTWAEETIAAIPASARLPVMGDRRTAIEELMREVTRAAEKADAGELGRRSARAGHYPVSDTPLIVGADPRHQRDVAGPTR